LLDGDRAADRRSAAPDGGPNHRHRRRTRATPPMIVTT
jgi:hypothetical protein